MDKKKCFFLWPQDLEIRQWWCINIPQIYLYEILSPVFHCCREEDGHWYSKFYKYLLSFCKILGTFHCEILEHLVQNNSPKTSPSIILLYRRGHLVYHHWGCSITSIYRPLSYPLRSWIKTLFLKFYSYIPIPSN